MESRIYETNFWVFRFHLREHANQHNGNKPYTCEECGKAFYKRIQLRQHRLSHGTKKYACPICGMTFSRRGNMNAHMKRHDKSDGVYTCSVSISEITSNIIKMGDPTSGR